MKVAIVHDYLTQRGGAERVVLSMLKAFPGAPVYTSLYAPDRTFPEFREVDVRTTFLDRVPLFRRNHRLALPVLASAFQRLHIEADAAVCSSTGWAHGASVDGRKIVYCNTPAHWLYQSERYLGGRRRAARVALRLLRPHLTAWDRRAASTATRYLANSSVTRDRIRATYGIESDVLLPPVSVDASGPLSPVDGVAPEFFLSVARLLPYKNVGAVVEAFADLPEEQLVVVGSGPDERRLRNIATANVRFAGSVSDPELRWLYTSCKAIVAAAYEDFGLTPVEGAAFGKPSAVLRYGGYLDTVIEDETGVFFDRPAPAEIRAAARALSDRRWNAAALEAHAETFSEARFVERLRQAVLEPARDELDVARAW